MTQPDIVHPLRPTEATTRFRRVFIRDLVLSCLIGVHRHEQDGEQRVRINVDLTVAEETAPIDDKLANVVCYEVLVDAIGDLVAAGHVNLVETLAERIAETCLADCRVHRALIRVEKLDVFANATSVGVEIERTSPTS